MRHSFDRLLEVKMTHFVFAVKELGKKVCKKSSKELGKNVRKKTSKKLR